MDLFWLAMTFSVPLENNLVITASPLKALSHEE